MNGDLAPTTAQLRALRDALAFPSAAGTDAERIDQLRVLEELKSAAAAAQAEIAVAFDRSQRRKQALAGVPGKEQDKGVGEQVALALRMSPYRGRRWLGWAKILCSELTATRAELAAGRTTEWRAMLVARETACLSRDDRALVDRELAPQLQGWGDRRVEVAARRMAQRLDPQAAVRRARVAESERRVTLRPVPDTMCRLTAVLPVAQGVAAYAALTRAADLTTGVGDERGRGQIMADTLVERLTGQQTADAVPAETVLLMTDRTLLDGDAEPAELVGHGPLPAGVARRIACNPDAPRWIRRLYTDGAKLVALESRRRSFTPGQRLFFALRDQTCCTPYCDAPIRHADHIRPWSRGGPTAVINGQGTCEACNLAKEAHCWTTTARGNDITTITPTGHRYVSRPPAPPGTAPPDTAPPVQRPTSPAA